MTRIAVLYDFGAVPVGEIGIGLADLGEIVFLVPSGSAHVEELRPVMEMLGEVRPLISAAPAALRPDAVLTFSEPMIRPAAALCEAAGTPGPSVHTAHLFTDKGLQRRALREAGIEQLRAAVVPAPEDWQAALDIVGLPAIVKPVNGSASRDTYAMRTGGEARVARETLGRLPQWPGFIIEEWLHGRPSEPYGDYVSVESVATPDGITHLVVTGKTPVAPPFRGTGRIWPSQLGAQEEQEIRDLVTRALRAVGSDCGHTHTELKLTPDGPRIIEINGRISGHVNAMARDTCGIDLVRIAGLIALGEHPPLRPFDFGQAVHFQYNNVSPIEQGQLLDVHGVDVVRSLPGVTAYRNFVRPGDELPGGTSKHDLDTLSGICDNHDHVVPVIDAARRALDFEIRFPDGVRMINGLDLPLH